MTVPEAARLLAVPEREVYEWMRDRGLPHVRIQDRYFIHRAKLHEWAREHYVRVHPDVFAEAGTVGTVPGAELADALHAGGLHRLRAPESEREGVRAIVAALGLPPSIDPALLCDVVMARRALGFAIDRRGVGLPRLNEPLLSPGAPALFLFAFEPGWKLGEAALDRAFVLVAPTVRVHQRLLAELDAALHQPAFRDAVLEAGTSGRLEEVARRTNIPAPAVAAG